MQYRPLGNTDEQVSILTLGSMTWGEQNSEAEAHAQLDLAVDYGINLIDTAEMYPVPPKPDTQGRTEQYIGTWLAQGHRDRVLLATKAAGPARGNNGVSHIRDGQARHDRANLQAALDASLQRLRTDYVDLYQLHWPDRSTNFFGNLGYRHVANEDTVAIEETLDALDALVKAGKIRYIGLSNETPWGVSEFLRIAERRGLARVVSIQNPYNLLNRSFEVGLAEIAVQEQAGLLAYSPLAFGVLSGKYLHGAQPAEGRLTRWKRFSRYTNPQAQAATESYAQIAQDHGLSLTQMSLAFIREQCFVTSTIIGATTLAQLKENIDSVQVELGTEVMQAIEAVQVKYPNPAP